MTVTRRTSAVARLHRAVTLRSLVLLHSTGRAYGLDALTGEVVNVAGERPLVHASGAFHAYPFGMPGV